MATEYAIFAGGCFWCTEAIFNDLMGVQSATSGYIGGHTDNPSYEEVCRGTTGHAEGVKIGFDPDVIGYGDLLDVFFATHDPTQLNRQGGDVGTQYRSAIYPETEAQKTEAEAAIARAAADWPVPGVTAIEAFATWYPAEDYHQTYFERVGDQNPYCAAVIAPKLQKFRKSYQARLKK